MKTIEARNVNAAFRLGMMLLREEGREVHGRGGDVIEVPEPVSTRYNRSDERVITIPERDANPFFHFFEALWMLHGDEDVEFVSWFNSRIKDYSDDGKTFHGAYGYRWRHYWGTDQIEEVVQLLIDKPETRRAVICMWDPLKDLNMKSRDIPCNDVIFFRRRRVFLDMTVSCRSNDVIWGAYGANAVHLSFLQEYIARRVGCMPGTYTQISNSFHAYVSNPQWDALKDINVMGYCPYIDGDVEPYPIMDAPEFWDEDLDNFLKWARNEWPRGYDFDGSPQFPYQNCFFTEVAEPMFVAWRLHKFDGKGLALMEHIGATDWRLACTEWLQRRES